VNELSEEVSLDDESSQILVARIIEALKRTKSKQENRESLSPELQAKAAEIVEQVSEGLDDRSIESEVWEEYWRQRKKTERL
jgi:hypothetical protein